VFLRCISAAVRTRKRAAYLGPTTLIPPNNAHQQGSMCFWRPIRRISTKRGNTKRNAIGQHHLPIVDRTPRPNKLEPPVWYETVRGGLVARRE
jgi:hypothetical protein